MTLAHRNLDSIEERKRTTKDFFPHLKLPIALSSDNQFYQLHTLLPKTPLCTHKHAKHMYTHTCMLSHFSLCLIPCDPMNCSLPGSSVHGVLQAGVLKWVAMPSSRGYSTPRGRTHVFQVSCIGRQALDHQCYLGSPHTHIYIRMYMYIQYIL